MTPVIQVQALTKRFSGLTAVNELSFTVNQGDVYGFLGQNGAGKSTTIRMLLTLIAPTSGNIKIFGKDIRDNRNWILQQTGAVIERPDLYKYLSAIDNLALFSRLSGVKPTTAMLMKKLEQVGLADRAGSKVKTFSQGMKQRLGIAVAMVHNPSLIILDEPTNGLDPQGIADIRNLIISLSREQGKTILVSSHLLNEMEQMATRLIIIDKGKKMVEGDMKDLLDPAHVHLEVSTLDLKETMHWITTSNWARFPAQLGRDSIQIKMERKDISAFTRELSNSGSDIISINPRNSLEEYFLTITGRGQHV